MRRNGTLVVLLLGGLYGLPQASLLWYERQNKMLTELGYIRTEMDPCLYIKYKSDGEKSIVVVHVDDYGNFHTDPADFDELVKAVQESFGTPTVHTGEVGVYVGVEYQYDRDKCSVRLTQMKYVNKLLEDLKVTKTKQTPADDQFMNIDHGSPVSDYKVFLSVLMCVFYLGSKTRPDLQPYVAFLATRSADCRVQDQAKLDRVVHYLNFTRTRGIVLRIQGTTVIESDDASYAIHERARSQSAMHLTLGTDGLPPPGYGGPILVKCNIQKLVATSSFEAELNARHQYRDYIIFFRSILSDLGFDQSGPSIILQDNEAAILTLERGQIFKGRSKFIDVRVFHATDLVNAGVIKFVKVHTDLMPADPATKPMWAKADMYKLARLCNDTA